MTLTLLNAAGATSLLLRYSNGGSTGTVSVYVNGTKLPSVALPTTGDWGTTDTVSIPLSTPLGTGNNTVRIAREAEEAWVNYYDVTPSFLIDANSGTLTGNARAHQIGGDRQPAVNIPDNADSTSGTGSVTLTLPNPAGTRSILLRYSNGNTAQPDTATISINGQTPFTAHLPTTGDWTKTAIVTIPLDTPLTNSSNTITISRVTNNPTTGRPDGWINYYDVPAQSAPNRIALSDNNLLYESSGTYNVWKNGQTESFGLAERHVRRQDPLRPAQRHRSGTRVR